MSKSELSRQIEGLSRNAVRIAEHSEHRPMLITPAAVVPIVFKGQSQRGDVSRAVRAACAMLRPRWGVCIHEAWMVREGAPEWVYQAVMKAGTYTGDIPREMRDETLVLYGEDDEGNWHFRQYVIARREVGGLTLKDDLHGGPDAQVFKGNFLGFVPRKVSL